MARSVSHLRKPAKTEHLTLFVNTVTLFFVHRGDYRSGKRLNMRKVIPYIASQFRKDKIWLRRTKPSKRQYQIMLAVDDSSSMNDNHSKQVITRKAWGLLKAADSLDMSWYGMGNLLWEGNGTRLIDGSDLALTSPPAQTLTMNLLPPSQAAISLEEIAFVFDRF